jgi:hypothetical protein
LLSFFRAIRKGIGRLCTDRSSLRSLSWFGFVAFTILHGAFLFNLIVMAGRAG